MAFQLPVKDEKYVTWLPAVLLCLVMMIASLFLFWFVNDLHQQEVTEQFRSRARLQTRQLQRNMGQTSRVVDTMHDFFVASNDIQFAKFKLFSRKLIQEHDGLQAAFWVPDVERINLGFQKYPLRQQRPALYLDHEFGTIWPPYYTGEGILPNSDCDPINILQHPELETAANRAKSNQDTVFSGEFFLRCPSRREAFFAVRYVGNKKFSYRGSEFSVTANGGYVGLLVDLSAVFSSSFREQDTRNIELFMFNEKGRFLRYFGSSPPESSHFDLSTIKQKHTTVPSFTRKMSIAGRTWRLLVYPGSDFHPSRIPFRSWLILICGLLLSLLSSGYLYNILYWSQQNEKRAKEDALTGLYNRRYLCQNIKKEMKRSARFGDPLSLLIIDLDHFKQINDTYGHRAGDRVLEVLAEVMRKNTRDVDLPARYGGEEFAVLFPETESNEALHVGDRIRKELEERTFQFDGENVSITCSGGVAEFPSDGGEMNVDELIERADRALYDSKQSGRNTITVETDSPENP